MNFLLNKFDFLTKKIKDQIIKKSGWQSKFSWIHQVDQLKKKGLNVAKLSSSIFTHTQTYISSRNLKYNEGESVIGKNITTIDKT